MRRRSRMLLLLLLALLVPVAAVAILGSGEGAAACVPSADSTRDTSVASDSVACVADEEPPCLASRIGLPCRE